MLNNLSLLWLPIGWICLLCWRWCVWPRSSFRLCIATADLCSWMVYFQGERTCPWFTMTCLLEQDLPCSLQLCVSESGPVCFDRLFVCVCVCYFEGTGPQSFSRTVRPIRLVSKRERKKITQKKSRKQTQALSLVLNNHLRSVLSLLQVFLSLRAVRVVINTGYHSPERCHWPDWVQVYTPLQNSNYCWE